MALVSCKECRKEISSKADACPNCGAKPPKRVGVGTYVRWAIAIFFGVVVFRCSTAVNDVAEKSGVEYKTTATAAPAKPAFVPTPTPPAPPPSPEYLKEVERISALSPTDFCSKELRKLKGKKGAMPQPWYDALIARASAFDVPGDHMIQIQDGRVLIGMNQCAAVAAWGRPESINKSTYSFGTKEQWVYGGRNYLYFSNGKLDSFQN